MTLWSLWFHLWDGLPISCLCGVRDRNQGCTHIRQTFYQLSYLCPALNLFLKIMELRTLSIACFTCVYSSLWSLHHACNLKYVWFGINLASSHTRPPLFSIHTATCADLPYGSGAQLQCFILILTKSCWPWGVGKEARCAMQTSPAICPSVALAHIFSSFLSSHKSLRKRQRKGSQCYVNIQISTDSGYI